MVTPHLFRNEHTETITTNSIYGNFYSLRGTKKIAIGPQLLQLFQYVESNTDRFLAELEEAVRIKSISGNPVYEKDVHDMMKLVERWLVKLGIKYECFNIGDRVIDGKLQKIGPLVYATCGRDPSKKTLLVYCYVDVACPNKAEWKTDPWVITKGNDRRFYGCGIATGKGSLINWFHAIQGFKDSKMELPINITFVIESMHYQKSMGFMDFMDQIREDLRKCHWIVTTDSEWIGEKYPCLIYGTVGMLYYDVTMEKSPDSDTDLKEDMNKIFEHLSDNEEHILIPHFNDHVEQITPDEEKMYDKIDFDPAEIVNSLPEYKKDWDKMKILMHFWRLPSIWMGENEDCSCEQKDTTVIKRKLIIKIVPRQIVEESDQMVHQFINKIVKKLDIKHTVTVNTISTSRPWFENFLSHNYRAARRATIQVYKDDATFIRDDKDRLSLTMLENKLEKVILYLPLANKGSNLGEANENISRRNLYEGCKLLMAYIMQLAHKPNKN